MDDKRLLLTPQEAADMLSVSTKTLYRWRLSGYGPRAILRGERFVRYSLRELEKWVERVSA